MKKIILIPSGVVAEYNENGVSKQLLSYQVAETIGLQSNGAITTFSQTEAGI